MSRQPRSWLIWDVGQEMKRVFKILAGILVIAAFAWGYIYREPVSYHFSSFAGDKVMRLHKSKYATGYHEAKTSPESDRFRYRMRIRWDLWCIAMNAEIQTPKEKDGVLFYRVDATDRTDTECIYIFGSDGSLLEIAWVPLA
jgi:hypothetical protein